MRTVADIIALWESAEAFARDMGVSGLTARAWRRRNSIPAQYWTRVVDVAAKTDRNSITLEVLAGLAALPTKTSTAA